MTAVIVLTPLRFKVIIATFKLKIVVFILLILLAIGFVAYEYIKGIVKK